MPGVPSGRACAECRKQKKKCDETKPACSRCIRLGILCIGPGEKRYKFMVQTDLDRGSSSSQSGSVTPNPAEQIALGEVNRTPSNELTTLIDAFTERVKFTLETDLRYSLTWAYGGFLLEVPRRLGTNAALDAAARALLTAHGHFMAFGGEATPKGLSEYSHALNMLRLGLDDPIVARSASTLCAVMLLMFCQVFIGLTKSGWTGHCEGAAQILRAKGTSYSEADDFESAMFLTLRGPVLCEGLFNKKIRLTRYEWDQLIKSKLERILGGSQTLFCLARIPDIVQRRHDALAAGRYTQLGELRDEAREIYDTSAKICDKLLGHYRDAASKASNTQVRMHRALFSPQDWIRWANWQRLYGFALFATCILNYLLRTFGHEGETHKLEAEAAEYANDIIALADEAVVFRPLGSSYMVLCLYAAWIGVGDSATRESINKHWEDYCLDMPNSRKLHLEQLTRLPEFGFID